MQPQAVSLGNEARSMVENNTSSSCGSMYFISLSWDKMCYDLAKQTLL